MKLIRLSKPEIISIESSQAFVEGDSIIGTDNAGREVNIRGKSDGEAAFIIPTDVEPGTYTIEFSRGSLTSTLSVEVESTSFPLNPEVYIEDFSDKLSASITKLEFSNSVEDKQYKEQLLDDLDNFKDEMPNLSKAEVQVLSRFLYTNLDELVSSQSSVFSYSAAASPNCPAAIVSLIISVNLTYDAAATALTNTLLPPQARALLGVGSVVAAGASVASAFLVQSQCIDRIVRIINSDDDFNSLAVANSETLLRAQYSTTNYIRAAATETAITFYDGDTKPITVIAEYELSSKAVSAIRDLQGLISSIGSVIPDSLQNKVDALDDLIEKDISGEVILQQIRSGSVLCSGTTSGYTCSFPDDNQIHDQALNFTYTVTHADAESPFIKNGMVAPRDVPILQDQSFSVTPGSGEINRIEIQVSEDTNSPNYELTKVLGFQLVDGPEYGVILKEFNEFGILDYAADITDDMPEQVTLQVRVWNKYGYSDTTTVTLNLSPRCNEDTPPPVIKSFVVRCESYNAGPSYLKSDRIYRLTYEDPAGIVTSGSYYGADYYELNDYPVKLLFAQKGIENDWNTAANSYSIRLVSGDKYSGVVEAIEDSNTDCEKGESYWNNDVDPGYFIRKVQLVNQCEKTVQTEVFKFDRFH